MAVGSFTINSLISLRTVPEQRFALSHVLERLSTRLEETEREGWVKGVGIALQRVSPWLGLHEDAEGRVDWRIPRGSQVRSLFPRDVINPPIVFRGAREGIV